ncbi:MAG: anti-sigma factor family protein [Mycobacterium leprae]
MQCEQIRGLLGDFVAGRLPNYKAAWVAQHLVWCTECQTTLEQVRRTGKEVVDRTRKMGQEVAVTVELPASADKPPVVYQRVGPGLSPRARRRRRMRWLVFTVLFLALAAAGFWFCFPPSWRNLPAFDWSPLQSWLHLPT